MEPDVRENCRVTRRIEPSPPSALTLELLDWVAERPRTYAETMAAWQTFYRHMPIWEDASRDGLVTLLAGDGESNAPRVCLTPFGRAARDRRPIRVSILDDYFDTLHTLPCFAKLAPFDVTASNGAAVKVAFLGKAKGTVGDSSDAASKQFG